MIFMPETLKWYLLLLYQARDINSKSRRECFDLQTVVASQLGLPNKGRAIKGFVVYRANNLFTLLVLVAEYVLKPHKGIATSLL